MFWERSFLIKDLPDYLNHPDSILLAKLIGGLRIKKDLESTRVEYFEGQLLAMKKEDEEEKNKANEEQV